MRPTRSKIRRAAALLLVSGAALAFGACAGLGGGEEGDLPGSSRQGPASGGDMLAAADVEVVIRAQRQIAACRDGGDTRGVDAAVTRLIAIYRDGPDEIFQFGSSTREGRPMSDVLEEIRTGLQRCGDAAAVARVDRALQSDG